MKFSSNWFAKHKPSRNWIYVFVTMTNTPFLDLISKRLGFLFYSLLLFPLIGFLWYTCYQRVLIIEGPINFIPTDYFYLFRGQTLVIMCAAISFILIIITLKGAPRFFLCAHLLAVIVATVSSPWVKVALAYYYFRPVVNQKVNDVVAHFGEYTLKKKLSFREQADVISSKLVTFSGHHKSAWRRAQESLENNTDEIRLAFARGASSAENKLSSFFQEALKDPIVEGITPTPILETPSPLVTLNALESSLAFVKSTLIPFLWTKEFFYGAAAVTVVAAVATTCVWATPAHSLAVSGALQQTNVDLANVARTVMRITRTLNGRFDGLWNAINSLKSAAVHSTNFLTEQIGAVSTSLAVFQTQTAQAIAANAHNVAENARLTELIRVNELRYDARILSLENGMRAVVEGSVHLQAITNNHDGLIRRLIINNDASRHVMTSLLQNRSTGQALPTSSNRIEAEQRLLIDLTAAVIRNYREVDYEWITQRNWERLAPSLEVLVTQFSSGIF